MDGGQEYRDAHADESETAGTADASAGRQITKNPSYLAERPRWCGWCCRRLSNEHDRCGSGECEKGWLALMPPKRPDDEDDSADRPLSRRAGQGFRILRRIQERAGVELASDVVRRHQRNLALQQHARKRAMKASGPG